MDDSEDETTNGKTTLKTSEEVCLSSDSEDSDIICDEVDIDIEFIGYGNGDRKRSKKPSKNQDLPVVTESDINQTNDDESRASPRLTVLLPPIVKSSPKISSNVKSSPNSRKLSAEARIEALGKRFEGLKNSLEPESVHTVFNDSFEEAVEPMETIEQSSTSLGSSSSTDDEEQIEGVEDNCSSEESEDQMIEGEKERKTDESMTSSLDTMALSSPRKVFQKSDVCIQTEAEDIEKKRSTENDLFSCFYGCGQVFNDALLHYKHEKFHLNEMKSKGIKTFKCTVNGCRFVGLTQSELMYHNSEHSGVFICRLPLCLFRAETAANLNRHILVQHNAKKRRKQRGIKCNCGEFSCR